jgi:hypothetical protein
LHGYGIFGPAETEYNDFIHREGGAAMSLKKQEARFFREFKEARQKSRTIPRNCLK